MSSSPIHTYTTADSVERDTIVMELCHNNFGYTGLPLCITVDYLCALCVYCANNVHIC